MKGMSPSLRRIVRERGVSEVSRVLADQLGIKPQSVARQLYYSMSGQRSLSERYERALRALEKDHSTIRYIEAVEEKVGSLSEVSRIIAGELGLKPSSVRRQLQRVKTGERSLPASYRKALKVVEATADYNERTRRRTRQLLEAGYDPEKLRKDLGLTPQKFTAFLAGRTGIPKKAREKVDRRYRYITTEKPRRERQKAERVRTGKPGRPPAPSEHELFQLGRGGVEPPEWARHALDGAPSEYYRFYAYMRIETTVQLEYSKYVTGDVISPMLHPALPGNVDPETLIARTYEVANRILMEQFDPMETIIEPLYIFRHFKPQRRL